MVSASCVYHPDRIRDQTHITPSIYSVKLPVILVQVCWRSSQHTVQHTVHGPYRTIILFGLRPLDTPCWLTAKIDIPQSRPITHPGVGYLPSRPVHIASQNNRPLVIPVSQCFCHTAQLRVPRRRPKRDRHPSRGDCKFMAILRSKFHGYYAMRAHLMRSASRTLSQSAFNPARPAQNMRPLRVGHFCQSRRVITYSYCQPQITGIVRKPKTRPLQIFL